MVTSGRTRRLKPLSRGRPPALKPKATISRKATRKIIREHHTLKKEQAKAIADGDSTKCAAISEQLEVQGGIESYQTASLLGQTSQRGGDSSKILMSWLAAVVPTLREYASTGNALRMLEVGALSTTNACSASQIFDMTLIDRRSTSKNIEQQDFIERPLPRDDGERFHLISLSLVLNYVPDPVGRGNMLQRTLEFLTKEQEPSLQGYFPSLFLVLPAPCVQNSRYMDEARLEAIMQSLGYTMSNKKLSSKLIYYLWYLKPGPTETKRVFKKETLRTGSNRNNFSILLK